MGIKVQFSDTNKLKINSKGAVYIHGEDGATFFPSLSQNGELSWNNDKGLENPPAVNIRGPKGEPGNDYVLTDADVQDIAEQAAELLEVGDIDFSEYAKKDELPTKVSQLDNDAGYLTRHQDISGKLDASALPEAINAALAQAKESGDFKGEPGKPGKTPVVGVDYFTEAEKQVIAEQAADLVDVPDIDLTGYATEEFVKNKIAEAELSGEEIDLSDYALKTELPTKVSQLENDKKYLTEHQDISGKLDADKLPKAVNDALAEAKASGEFDGKDGYTPVKGKDYFDGEPGVSATHSWNGTKLTITSASGTSSADLKGDKGEPGYTPKKGIDYFDGQPGKDGKDGDSGVYVGSGDMPEDCNVQIDPDGESLSVDWLIAAVIEKLPIYSGEVVAV